MTGGEEQIQKYLQCQGVSDAQCSVNPYAYLKGIAPAKVRFASLVVEYHALYQRQ